jgi:hypothetical protein
LISVKTGRVSWSGATHSRRSGSVPARHSWQRSEPTLSRPASSREPHEKQYTMIHPFLDASIGIESSRADPPER